MISSNNKHPSISVIIPVKDEAAKIRECIDGILNENIKVREIIVIDSGSTDETIEILTDYELVKIVEIPSNEFNHGETRNLAVTYCQSELCLFTVGDAKPVDNRWIEKLLHGFYSDDVIAVCGQQVAGAGEAGVGNIAARVGVTPAISSPQSRPCRERQ